MPRELEAYLRDVFDAGNRILIYTNGMTFEDYMQSQITRDAVERNFSIIGEALNQATRYYPEFEGKIQQARDIVDFRNRVMHGYFSVEDQLVWSAIKVGLPQLMAEVEAILKERPIEAP